MKLKLAKWIHANLAGERYEHTAPGDRLSLEFGERDVDPGPLHDRPMFSASTSNDGYELWIAYTGGKWLVHFRAEYARQLAWFILWDWWAKATWCGLRRKIWYWSNRQILYAIPGYKEKWGRNRDR